MALVLNGSGSITGLSAGGLPDGSVTADDIASTLDLSGKTVTLPAGTGGKVLQVVQAVKTDTTSTTSTSFGDISGLSVAITPSSTSNKILVLLHLGGIGNPNNAILFNILRGSTALAQPDSGTAKSTINVFPGVTLAIFNSSISWLDSPSTTSSTTYKVQWRVDGSTGYLNRHTANVNYNSVSSITLMEIAA